MAPSGAPGGLRPPTPSGCPRRRRRGLQKVCSALAPPAPARAAAPLAAARVVAGASLPACRSAGPPSRGGGPPLRRARVPAPPRSGAPGRSAYRRAACARRRGSRAPPGGPRCGVASAGRGRPLSRPRLRLRAGGSWPRSPAVCGPPCGGGGPLPPPPVSAPLPVPRPVPPARGPAGRPASLWAAAPPPARRGWPPWRGAFSAPPRRAWGRSTPLRPCQGLRSALDNAAPVRYTIGAGSTKVDHRPRAILAPASAVRGGGFFMPW